jgi:hypothetical protein
MLAVASQYICALLSSKHFTARANFPAVKEGNHGGLPLQNGESDPELFALLYIEVFGSLRKFSGGPWLSKAGICSRQDAKSGSLISLRPLRLCVRYSEFWLRLRRTRSFVVVYFSLIPSSLCASRRIERSATSLNPTSRVILLSLLASSIRTRNPLSGRLPSSLKAFAMLS